MATFDSRVFDPNVFDASSDDRAGLGSGMQVKVSPIGRQPYFAPLLSAPVFSSQELGGYSTATIVQGRTRGDRASRMLYADVTIYGRQGPCWQGVVESFERDGTLRCVGPQQALGWHRALASNPYTDLDVLVGAVIDNAFPSFISKSKAFVQTGSPDMAVGVAFGNISQAEWTAKCASYTGWDWGFYFERVNGVDTCCAHFAPQPTTPDYIVTLSAEDAGKFMGDSMTGMVSQIVTEWGDGPTRTTTTDTNANHYLVQIGRTRAEMYSASEIGDAADAATVANAMFATRSTKKAGATGTANTSRIQLPSGMPAYPPSIRPGRIARVIGLPDGPADLRISSTECVGDSSVSIGLGIDSGNLEALLARIG